MTPVRACAGKNQVVDPKVCSRMKIEYEEIEKAKF